jgi:MFS family permease
MVTLPTGNEGERMSSAPAHRSDVILLFVTRMIRMFAYGALALILVLYLKEVGLGGTEIGLLLTMTLAGDTVLSLWITTSADRIGRKRMLLAGAGLMILGGLGFALSGGFVPLLVAATIGVISPRATEVGPFLAIEQAALAHLVGAARRTRVFAWYHLAGSLAAAAGAWACGRFVYTLQAREMEPLASYRAVCYAYAGVGGLLAVCFLFLSAAAEEPPAAPEHSSARRGWLGLHQSRRIVLILSSLFALDAFAGGFVLDGIIADWFHVRFGADTDRLGEILGMANLLAGLSALAAASLARRLGLLNTMVLTHVPSNLLLILVPFMPSLPWAVAVLWLRFAISQMDVPTRQSYTVAVVSPDERSAAAGVTGVARSTGAALSPVLAGPLLAHPSLIGVPFVLAGALKLLYDGLLYRLFRRVKPPEEAGR